MTQTVQAKIFSATKDEEEERRSLLVLTFCSIRRKLRSINFAKDLKFYVLIEELSFLFDSLALRIIWGNEVETNVLPNELILLCQIKLNC